MWDNSKQSNLHGIEVPEEEQNKIEQQKKNVFEEIKDEIFQKLILKQKQKLH